MNEKITIDGITYVKEKENHTLADLEQKLINKLYESNFIYESDVELLKILLKN